MLKDSNSIAVHQFMAYPVATSALTITLFECDHPDIGVPSIDCTGALFALFFYLYRTI